MVHAITVKWKQIFIPILTLFVVTLICFRPGYAPILYFDDWLTFGDLYLFGGLRLIDFSNRRPLLNAIATILLHIFGLDLNALYFVHMIVIFLCAVMVFFLARRLFSDYQFLALPAALLFLVYPVDMTRLWLSMNYIWINYLAALIVLYLLLDYAEKGGLWKLVVSLPLIVLPLLAYEAQLGLVLAGSVLLAVFTPRIPLRRRLLLLYPLAIMALFVFWRFYIQPNVFQVHDPYIVMGFQTRQSLIERFASRILAFFPPFVESWILPFSTLLGVSARRLLLIVGAAIACNVALMLWVSKDHNASPKNSEASPAASVAQACVPADQVSFIQKKKETNLLFAIFGIGGVMFLAGFFPYILIVSPAMDWFSSRGFMFSIFGTVLVLSSLTALAALWMAKNRLQMRLIILAVFIPLILMGITEQIWNQNEYRKAWAEQKHFWRALFAAVPNLQDNTTVVVVMPYDNPKQPYGRLPFTAEWELTGGIKILYNNGSLKAIPYTPNHVEGTGYASLKPGGVFSSTYGRIPYDQVLFVYYEQGSYQVKIMDRVNDELPINFQIQGYAPDTHLLPDPPQSTPYRRLVIP